MENIKIDYQIVDIGLIKPNTWNPKDSIQDSLENKQAFEEIKKMITIHGLNDPILVRQMEDSSYEIIDGFHRYTACKELGYTKLPINNAGKISAEEAKAQLLGREDAKVKTNPIKVAELLREISLIMPIEEMAKIMPYSAEIIKNKIDLIDFNWEQFNNDNEQEAEEGKVKFNFQLDSIDAETANQALAKTGLQNNEAFLKICQEYLNI